MMGVRYVSLDFLCRYTHSRRAICLPGHTDGRTIHAHLALVLKIALVGDDDDWERVLVLHSEYLLVEGRDFFKRVARRNRIDE